MLMVVCTKKEMMTKSANFSLSVKFYFSSLWGIRTDK